MKILLVASAVAALSGCVTSEEGIRANEPAIYSSDKTVPEMVECIQDQQVRATGLKPHPVENGDRQTFTTYATPGPITIVDVLPDPRGSRVELRFWAPGSGGVDKMLARCGERQQ